MIRLQGINNGAFVVSPDSVWYAHVLLLFSTSAMTYTGSKSFKCALVSTLESYDDPDNGNYDYYTHYSNICYHILGKLPVARVPVGDTGTIQHHLRNTFPGAPSDHRPGAGDGCRMWSVNFKLWALG